jgi:hypothetical protein
VPIFKKRFTISAKDVPKWIRDKQKVSECYRLQFPLDLAAHLTAHRAQGQTLRDCLLDVDLSLDRPDCKPPNDITSVAYVALTRANKLENLLVSPIFPEIWKKLGKSSFDDSRRLVEKTLTKGALKFAEEFGMYDEAVEELQVECDRSSNEQEWVSIKQMESLIVQERVLNDFDASDFETEVGDTTLCVCARPTLSERHIGIDQGVKNFAIAVVDRPLNGLPVIVFAENYTDLDLSDRFTAADVAIALKDKTELFAWMQVPGHEPVSDYAKRVFQKVDRVIVHVEQISFRNKHAKQFGIELGRLLQRMAGDPLACVVKLSKPYFYGSTSVAFKLGQNIVTSTQLESLSDTRDTYRQRKQQSAAIFRYIMELGANQTEKFEDMGLQEVDEEYVEMWENRFSDSDLAIDNYEIRLANGQVSENERRPDPIKLDDLGDALLHALQEIVCGSSNYRQLIPSPSVLHNNRTVALSFFPDQSYFVVCYVTWNSVVVENIGTFCTGLDGDNVYYKSDAAASTIEESLPSELRTALTEMNGDGLYTGVDHIKVVVKQQTKFEERGLISRREAGAFTTTACNVVKSICDTVMGPTSGLTDRKDKACGRVYMRTDRETGRKYQVVLSTGKHTNAVLSCLGWFHEHMPSFLASRKLHLCESEKYRFHAYLRKVAIRGGTQIELLHLSELARSQLASSHVHFKSRYHTRNYVDLLLIAMNKNQQQVKAIAANYRKSRQLPAAISNDT